MPTPTPSEVSSPWTPSPGISVALHRGYRHFLGHTLHKKEMTGLFFKPKKDSQYLGGHMKGFHCSLRKHPFLLALRRWDVSHGGTSVTQWQKFHTNDANQCLHHKSGSHGVPNICPFLRVLWSILVNCCVYLPTISSETQMLRLEKTIFHKYWLFC